MWHKIFEYNDGFLFWKVGKYRGSTAGRINNTGYGQVCYSGKQYSTHRIIWEMFYPPIPNGMMIDHIDRNKLNNRIENLRLVTRGLNVSNSTKLTKRNTKSRHYSKYKGVTRHGKMFYVKIQRKQIGRFASEKEAAICYDTAALKVYKGHAVLNRDLFPEDFKNV